jgi:hypothetical protein
MPLMEIGIPLEGSGATPVAAGVDASALSCVLLQYRHLKANGCV